MGAVTRLGPEYGAQAAGRAARNGAPERPGTRSWLPLFSQVAGSSIFATAALPPPQIGTETLIEYLTISGSVTTPDALGTIQILMTLDDEAGDSAAPAPAVLSDRLFSDTFSLASLRQWSRNVAFEKPLLWEPSKYLNITAFVSVNGGATTPPYSFGGRLQIVRRNP